MEDREGEERNNQRTLSDLGERIERCEMWRGLERFGEKGSDRVTGRKWKVKSGSRREIAKTKPGGSGM